MSYSYNILIVEDSDADAELIQLRLQKLDMQINTSVLHRKKDIFSALQDFKYDLVICDYNLPKLNGLEVLKKVREKDNRLPFILISGYIGEEKAVDAMLEGASDYVLKDNLARLGPAVERELRNARQRHLSEEELDKLSMVARKTQDGVIIMNPDLQVEWVNEGFTEMTGYSLSDIKGQKTTNFLHGPDTSKDTEAKIVERLRNKQPFKGEVLHYTKNNREFWNEVEVIPIFDEKEEVKYHFSIQKDITEQKMGQLLGDVNEMARIGGWEIDLIEKSVNWTSYTRQLLGVGPDFEPNIKSAIGFFKEGEDQEKLEQAINKAIQDGSPYDLELKIVTEKGKELWVRVLGKPEFRKGKCISLKGSIQNIDSRKKAELQLQQLLKEKETLLKEVHHRVKNNLAVVSSMLQLQTFQETDSKLKDKLKIGMARIQTIANIHELLYQSESFSELRFDENLEDLLSKIRDSFSVDSQIDIELSLDPIQLNVNQALPCSLIVNEVFTNTLKHAYPNGENGSVLVWLKEEDEKIELSIKDDGIGLPENMESQNSSLGYLLIKTLVKQLKAEYRYQSYSQGTEFKLQFNKDKVKGM